MRRCPKRGKTLQADEYSRFTAFPDLGLSPVLFSIGRFDLRWYSLAYLAGIFVGFWYLLKLVQKPGSPVSRKHPGHLGFCATLGIIRAWPLCPVPSYTSGAYPRHPRGRLR